MILAVIPARGGSKRIPKKNLAMCAGKPLIVWTIEAALAAGLDRVVVSTDDIGIADIAYLATKHSPNRVLIVERPAELARDDTPDLPVFQHVLDQDKHWLIGMRGYDDLVVHLRPTAPLRTAKDIDAAVAFFRDRWASSLRSVVPAREHPGKMYGEAPPSAAWRCDFTVLRPLLKLHRPNDAWHTLPTVWRPCGFVDIIRAPFIRQGSMAGPIVAAWPVDEAKALDIDTEADLREAERRLMERVPSA